MVQICFDDDLVCKYDCDADTNHEYVGVDDDIDVVVLIVLMTTMMVIMTIRRRRRMTVLANSQGSCEEQAGGFAPTFKRRWPWACSHRDVRRCGW